MFVSRYIFLLISVLLCCYPLVSNGFSLSDKKKFSKYAYGQFLVYNTLYPNATDINYKQTYHCPDNGLKDAQGNSKDDIEIKILFLGDSYNRNHVYEFCESHNSVVYDWKYEIFRLEKFNSSYTCRVDNILFHAIPLFSSFPHGPYHHGHISTKNLPYIDTEPRIPKIIEEYKKENGDPTFIIIRSDIWDLATLVRNKRVKMPDSLYEMGTNLKHCIDQIEQAFPESYIGSHTIPMIQWSDLNDYFPHAENLLRIIVAEHPSMFLLDWHVALLHKSPGEVNRDIIHPREPFNLFFLKNMLLVYSNWLKHSCALNKQQQNNNITLSENNYQHQHHNHNNSTKAHKNTNQNRLLRIKN